MRAHPPGSEKPPINLKINTFFTAPVYSFIAPLPSTLLSLSLSLCSPVFLSVRRPEVFPRRAGIKHSKGCFYFGAIQCIL